jgi:hypothetical protein
MVPGLVRHGECNCLHSQPSTRKRPRTFARGRRTRLLPAAYWLVLSVGAAPVVSDGAGAGGAALVLS